MKGMKGMKGNKDDGFAGDGQEAQVVRTCSSGTRQ